MTHQALGRCRCGECHSIPEAIELNSQEQIALCTNDERCQAAADEHDPGCPVEAQLIEDIGF